jgi:hypothetical protein
MCEEARPYYYDFLSEDSCGIIPQPVRSHIEQCPHCQKQINQIKVVFSQKDYIKSQQGQNSSAVTTMLQLHFAYIGEHVTCETVRPFLPGMLDPSIEIRVPTPITAHLDNCPQCAEDLKAIQKLNLNSTQLYGLSQFFMKGPSKDTTEFSEMDASVTAMAERADSEVVTIYSIDQSADARKAGKPDDLYFGFPISVEVITQKADVEEPVSNINFTAALKEKVLAMNMRPFLKIGVAAAAIIGFALLFNNPSAQAVSLEKIYKAIKFVNNVHILKSEPGETKLLTKITQEKWLSRTLDISLMKNEKGFVLWDVSNRQIQSKHSETGEIETTQMAEDVIPGFKQEISGSLGLMPFDDISKIPQGYEWIPVVDEIPEVAEGIEIYELELAKPTIKYRSSTEFYKWRFFVDPETNLPQKTEIFRKSSADSEYNLRWWIEVKYLSDSEIQAAIKDAGFEF